MVRKTISVVTLGAWALFWAASASAGADDGKALFDQKCKVCHSVGGQGGPMAAKGGPVDSVGSKRDGAWLHEYLKDPKSKVPDAKMPKMALTDQQIDDLVAYLLTLKGGN
jgi:mono/diheme cytochrome c family protein